MGGLETTSGQTLAFDRTKHQELPAKFEPPENNEVRVGEIFTTRVGPKNRVGISCVADKTEPRLMISDKLILFHMLSYLSQFFVDFHRMLATLTCVLKMQNLEWPSRR